MVSYKGEDLNGYVISAPPVLYFYSATNKGLSWTEVQEKYPVEYEEWYTSRRYTKPPRGESYQDMLQRVLASIHKIINENSENVVIVTHSAVIMCVQCYLTNTPFDKMTNFKTSNTSITELNSDLFL
ncbi:histidine phosphatase family protein [Carnobacterium mobile]|uniref:histidine phosphatase family protein n=1 Tax=Carnobacterium mobile TaxID=2750 RepID=UPI0009FD00EA